MVAGRHIALRIILWSHNVKVNVERRPMALLLRACPDLMLIMMFVPCPQSGRTILICKIHIKRYVTQTKFNQAHRQVGSLQRVHWRTTAV